LRILPDLSGIERVMHRIKEIERRFGIEDRNSLPTNRVEQKSFSSVLRGKRMKRKGSPAGIEALINEYSNKYGVDPLLALAVAKVESNLNPKVVSPKGAVGVMQLMPSTARELGVENLYAPSENIEGGIKYLRFLSDKYQGDIDMVLAAYNAGIGVVEKYNGVPPYKETQSYISKVKEMYRRLMKGE